MKMIALVPLIFSMPHLAYANDCDSIKKIVSLLAENPERLSKEEDTFINETLNDPSTKQYHPTIMLSGAKVCSLSIDSFEGTATLKTADALVYQCKWILENREQAETLATSISGATAQCLSLTAEKLDDSSTYDVRYSLKDKIDTWRGPGSLNIQIMSKKASSHHTAGSDLKYRISILYDNE